MVSLLQAQKADSLEQQLFAAIDTRNLVEVEHLLRQGANTEARSTNGVTPLMEAAEAGDISILSLLLDHGASATAKDEQGETALTKAARGGWVRIVKLLARLSETPDKNHALFAAVEGVPVKLAMDEPTVPIPPQSQTAESDVSWTASVEALLNSGVDIEARSEDGSTPLIAAAGYAQADVLRLLIRRGAKINARDKYGNTPLIAAACECALSTMNSAYDVVKLLLDEGASVNARNYKRETPLIMASGMTGDSKVLELLLTNGADTRLKDKNGKTALAIAEESHRDDKVQILKNATVR